jgi:hypothetical protein
MVLGVAVRERILPDHNEYPSARLRMNLYLEVSIAQDVEMVL